MQTSIVSEVWVVNGAGRHVSNYHCLFIEATNLPSPCSEDTQRIMSDIFDVLLDPRPEVYNLSASIEYAISARNVDCVMNFFVKTFQLNTSRNEICFEWARAAKVGSVELLKCMFNNGIDKDYTDAFGRSLLTWTIWSGKAEVVRYLLNMGATVPKHTSKPKFTFCKKCEKNRLELTLRYFNERHDDPCVAAIEMDIPEIVEMLVVDHGGQSCNSFTALAHAVRLSNVNVVEYLLNKNRYDINNEYVWRDRRRRGYRTLLTESIDNEDGLRMAKILLTHGADLDKTICRDNGTSSALFTAISRWKPEFIALFIRNGVNVNLRSFDNSDGKLLPFEFSVRYNRRYITEMLLLSGCSCGVFSFGNNKYKDDLKPSIKDLMKKWNVHENNVIPLKMQCRRAILIHLAPPADKKINELPLPLCLTTYLSIPELDDILEVYWEHLRNRVIIL